MFTGGTIIYPGGNFHPPDDVIQITGKFKSPQAMEACLLAHFKRLIEKQMPALAFRVAGYGANPPDFLIYRDLAEAASPFGLELTTFGFPTEQRQQNHWHFTHWQERLLEAYEKGRLAGLSGLKFDISFGDLTGPAPKVVDEQAFDGLVDALEGVAKLPMPAMSKEAGEDWVMGGGEQWPEGTIANGAITWRMSGRSNVPFQGSMLAKNAGFEVEVTVREYKPQDEVVADMNATIKAKDCPTNRELLIVAGGPTQSGRAFAASGVMAHRVLEQWAGPAEEPAYLHRVFLDIWGEEKVHVLYERT